MTDPSSSEDMGSGSSVRLNILSCTFPDPLSKSFSLFMLLSGAGLVALCQHSRAAHFS